MHCFRTRGPVLDDLACPRLQRLVESPDGVRIGSHDNSIFVALRLPFTVCLCDGAASDAEVLWSHRRAHVTIQVGHKRDAAA